MVNNTIRKTLLILATFATILILVGCEMFKMGINGILSYEDIETTEGIEVSASPNWSEATRSAQLVSYSISPSIHGVSIDSDSGIITISNTAQAINTSFAIRVVGIDGYKGSRNATIRVVIIKAITNNMAQYSFTYASTALSTTVGTETIFATTTNTIPIAALAKYELFPRNDTSAVPVGIIMDGATIKVAKITAAGTYQLSIVAIPTAEGYSGSLATEITIAVEGTRALSGTLTYANITGTEGTELTAAVSPTWSVADQTASYAISPLLDGTGLSFSTTTGAISGTPTAVIAGAEYTVTANGTGNFTGEITSAKFTITVESGVVNLNTFNLSYNTTVNAVFGTEKNYAVTTTIPAAASATYAIAAKDGTTDIAGISISAADATITVASTIAAGTYELTVTASTTADGYTGTKEADVTVIVDPKSISSYTLAYDIDANATYGIEKTYQTDEDNHAGQAIEATYTIALKADGTEVTGISINTAGTIITVASTTAAGTYEFTVTATGSGNYDESTAVDITVIVDPKSIDGYTLAYDIDANATLGVEKTYNRTSASDIPAEGTTYAIALTTGGTEVTGISISADGATITVAATTAAGIYVLTVKATGSANYKDSTTKDITIIVDPKSISSYTLAYDIDANATLGVEKTYNRTSASDIPAEGTTYAIALTTGGTEVTGISISADGATITVASNTAAGTYALTVTATGSGNYKDSTTVDITIIIGKPDLTDFSYASDGKIASGTAGDLALEAGAPSGDGVTYAIAANTTSDTGTHTPPEIDAATGVVSIDASTTAGTYKVTVTAASSPLYNAGTKETLVYVTVKPAGTDVGAIKVAVDKGITNFGLNANLNYLDVSETTSLYYLFPGGTTRVKFNGDISLWDVSSVEDMSLVFKNTTAFNGDLSKWNLSSVTDMSNMFQNSKKFNQDLTDWKDSITGTPTVTSMFDGSVMSPLPCWYNNGTYDTTGC